MFLVGHEDYDYEFESIGIKLVADPAASDFIMIAASRAPKMSLDQYGAMLAAAASSGIPALCCNPDRLMLTTEGLQPSAGEIAVYYERLGGRVVFVGKPYESMYAFAKRLTRAPDAVRRIAIGDSIDHEQLTHVPCHIRPFGSGGYCLARVCPSGRRGRDLRAGEVGPA